MKRLLVGAIALTLAAIPASAQSLEDLNVQVHGYATQGFLYTTQNNILTTSSSNGSPSWTEGVVNVSSQPAERFRLAIQARYFVLGNYGNTISLDYASADYTANDRFGVRFGKVKTPAGLFNEIQDIDPSYMWSLLPQSVYAITSRNSFLSHLGGVVYGTVALGPKFGKLEYRGWGGERTVAADDGLFTVMRESGQGFPNGISGVTYGAALHWVTPLPGLMLGASNAKQNQSDTQISVGNGTLTAPYTLHPFNQPNYFGRFERGKLMVASEYQRAANSSSPAIGASAASTLRNDNRAWYTMASYKVTQKLAFGAYNSQLFSRTTAPGPARFSKDWTVSGRYDFNQFLYAKLEQHFIDGTYQDYDITLNAGGLKPSTRLTILKVGLSF